MPRSATRSAIRSRICPWMVTSSAVVGSSAISRSRLAGERHGDGDALALAAGKLVRVGIDALGRIGKADAVEQCNRLVARLRGRKTLVPAQRLGDLAADGVHRIERRHRLLKDHADAVAAQLAVVGLGQADQFLPVEPDAAADHGALRQETHQRHRSDRLAATGLADQTEGLAALQRKADAAHRVGRAAAGIEPDAQIVDFDQRRSVGHHRSRDRRGSNRSRSPSPRRFSPSTAVAIARPG